MGYKIDVEQLEDLKSLVIVLDKEGNILKFNPFAQESTGFNYDQVSRISWFDTFITKGEKEELLIQFQENIEKAVSSWHFVCNIVCKDGNKKYINWTFSLLKNEKEEKKKEIKKRK